MISARLVASLMTTAAAAIATCVQQSQWNCDNIPYTHIHAPLRTAVQLLVMRAHSQPPRVAAILATMISQQQWHDAAQPQHASNQHPSKQRE